MQTKYKSGGGGGTVQQGELFPAPPYVCFTDTMAWNLTNRARIIREKFVTGERSSNDTKSAIHH